MEFEDMQVIWNSENQEKLYAINEEALFKKIKRKSASVNRSLVFVEFMMIFINLGTGLLLILDTYWENGQSFEYILPVVYLAYTLFFFFRRLTRKQETAQFEPTIVGEIDKALWQINYLIKQSQGMLIWYLLPIVIIAALTIGLNNNNLWQPLALIALVAPVAYYGGRWEINKCYMPKKRELEALRETILST